MIRAARFACTLTLMLAACGMIDGRRDSHPSLAGAARAADAPMASDSPVRVGGPYTVRGVTYRPADDTGYDEVGYASWYGKELAGNRTASGERFRPSGITAAHTTLPLPSYVEVTALDTGRTILVRINDRGPFSSKLLIDLSHGAAEQLGIAGRGRSPVRVRRVDPPEEDRARLRAGHRAPEREDVEERALADLRERLYD